MGAKARVGAGLRPLWAVVVGGLEVDQPRGFWAPYLLEAVGIRAADGRPFLVVVLSLAMDAVRSSSFALSSSCRVCAGLREQTGKDRLGILQLKPEWPPTILDDRTQAGRATFLRRFHCVSTLAEVSRGGPGGGDSVEEGVGSVALCTAQPVPSAAAAGRLSEHLRHPSLRQCPSFLYIPVAVFTFLFLKSVCVLTCPLQYPYRYICCVPYEMLGSGKSNQPTHRLLTVSTSAFD